MDVKNGNKLEQGEFDAHRDVHEKKSSDQVVSEQEKGMVLPQIDFQEQSIPFFYKYLVRRNYLSVLPDEKNHPSWQQETVKHDDDD